MSPLPSPHKRCLSIQALPVVLWHRRLHLSPHVLLRALVLLLVSASALTAGTPLPPFSGPPSSGRPLRSTPKPSYYSPALLPPSPALPRAPSLPSGAKKPTGASLAALQAPEFSSGPYGPSHDYGTRTLLVQDEEGGVAELHEGTFFAVISAAADAAALQRSKKKKKKGRRKGKGDDKGDYGSSSGERGSVLTDWRRRKKRQQGRARGTGPAVAPVGHTPSRAASRGTRGPLGNAAAAHRDEGTLLPSGPLKCDGSSSDCVPRLRSAHGKRHMAFGSVIPFSENPVSLGVVATSAEGLPVATPNPNSLPTSPSSGPHAAQGFLPGSPFRSRGSSSSPSHSPDARMPATGASSSPPSASAPSANSSSSSSPPAPSFWLVVWYHPSCLSCRAFRPALPLISSQVEGLGGGGMSVGQVNCRAYPSLSSYYHVTTYPTLLFFSSSDPHHPLKYRGWLNPADIVAAASTFITSNGTALPPPPLSFSFLDAVFSLIISLHRHSLFLPFVFLLAFLSALPTILYLFYSPSDTAPKKCYRHGYEKNRTRRVSHCPYHFASGCPHSFSPSRRPHPMPRSASAFALEDQAFLAGVDLHRPSCLGSDGCHCSCSWDCHAVNKGTKGSKDWSFDSCDACNSRVCCDCKPSPPPVELQLPESRLVRSPPPPPPSSLASPKAGSYCVSLPPGRALSPNLHPMAYSPARGPRAESTWLALRPSLPPLFRQQPLFSLTVVTPRWVALRSSSVCSALLKYAGSRSDSKQSD